MANELNINTDVLSHYINASGTPLESIRKKVSSVDSILAGKKGPSFNQLSKIAKIINIPTGLLMLDEVIEQPIEKLDFRTINSSGIESMSRELKDTINEMRFKQDFLKNEINKDLRFVGMFSIEDDVETAASTIRTYLNIPVDYMKEAKPKTFEYFRTKINDLGVFVFLNGKYKDNTHRNLNLKEFRGFVLSDKKAPLIFLNQKDSKNGLLFSLIHELVHLFIGADEIFNVIRLDDYEFDQVERFVNQVTAEILVPKDLFIKVGDKSLNELASIFPVSTMVLLRRKYDLNFISKTDYQQEAHALNEAFDQVKDKKKESTSGNYYFNLNYRMDKKFFEYVDNAIKNDKISYTEGFDILGVGYQGYKELEKGRR